MKYAKKLKIPHFREVFLQDDLSKKNLGKMKETKIQEMEHDIRNMTPPNELVKYFQLHYKFQL